MAQESQPPQEKAAGSGSSKRASGRTAAGDRGSRGPRTPRTLGPIADLERHLPKDWWATLFNAWYLKTDGDVVENTDNTRAEVDLLVEAGGLSPDDRVLDLCCGQGRHLLELARRGFKNLTGVDRSRYLIRLARERARRDGFEIRFHEGDSRRYSRAAGTADCVTVLGNSFGYFERGEDDLALLGAARRALRSRGVLVLDVTRGDWMRKHFEPRSWEWIDAEHFVCRERSLAADGERLVSRELIVHSERGVIADQFYAERLYDEAGIRALLAKAGFEGVEVAQVERPVSERDQDLGMMEQRMMLVARAPRREASPRRRGVPFPEVTVLLGDPSLPDSVKLEGEFSSADHDTVSRLREALDELSGYQFRYLDSHARWLDDLRREPPKFVLNLCDEGFENDAYRELNVPAFLEMLGVPYSGAGPACLAVCYDKAMVGSIARSLGLPVPSETFVHAEDHLATIPGILPALVKPVCGDSSIGITSASVCFNSEEMVDAVERLRRELPGRPLLVQEFLTGVEYSVGIVGNPGRDHRVLPLLEVDYSDLDPGLPQILGYESKWDPDSPYWKEIRYVESTAPSAVVDRMVDDSLTLFQRLGCRDYARFDFRTGADGEVKLLEVNPNPGWCWDGKMNLMAGFAGMRYSELLAAVIEAAQSRAAARGPRPPA